MPSVNGGPQSIRRTGGQIRMPSCYGSSPAKRLDGQALAMGNPGEGAPLLADRNPERENKPAQRTSSNPLGRLVLVELALLDGDLFAEFPRHAGRHWELTPCLSEKLLGSAEGPPFKGQVG
uniref:Uncharacterized protein n=1 Tax=Trichuris muris TaxID=70415 RepID=A0A5S6Q9H4_TRIMR